MGILTSMATLTPAQQKEYYASEGSKPQPLSPLDWLAQQKTLPSIADTTTGAATLPNASPDTTGGANLLTFKDIASQIVDIAKQKRVDLSRQFMAPMQGTVAASDFNSLFNQFNQSSDTYYKSTIEDIFPKPTPPNLQTITETDAQGNVTAATIDQTTGKLVSTVKLGKIGKPMAVPEGEKNEPPEVIAELQAAQTAINAGADQNAVRRRFLEKYPKKASLFNEYTKTGL